MTLLSAFLEIREVNSDPWSLDKLAGCTKETVGTRPRALQTEGTGPGRGGKT